MISCSLQSARMSGARPGGSVMAAAHAIRSSSLPAFTQASAIHKLTQRLADPPSTTISPCSVQPTPQHNQPLFSCVGAFERTHVPVTPPRGLLLSGPSSAPSNALTWRRRAHRRTTGGRPGTASPALAQEEAQQQRQRRPGTQAVPQKKKRSC